METWFRLLQNKMDIVDVQIMDALTNDDKDLEDAFIETIASRMSKRLNVSATEVKKRIRALVKAGIIRKIGAIIDPLKVWNYVYFVFVKADLSPPIIGLPLEYPSSWMDLVGYIRKLRKESDLARTAVRQAFPLQGTEWDLFLLVTTNERENLLKLCNQLVKSKFVEKIWSFSPVEGAGYIYEPITFPTKSDFERLFVDQIKKGVKLIEERTK